MATHNAIYHRKKAIPQVTKYATKRKRNERHNGTIDFFFQRVLFYYRWNGVAGGIFLEIILNTAERPNPSNNMI